MASSQDAPCYTVVFEAGAEYPSTSDLRSALQKGSDEVKIDTLRKIIISTINGNPQARFPTFSSSDIAEFFVAGADDAYHSICIDVQEQAPEEALAFLLGSMSEI